MHVVAAVVSWRLTTQRHERHDAITIDTAQVFRLAWLILYPGPLRAVWVYILTRTMHRFAMKAGCMTMPHKQKLVEALHTERLGQELQDAIAYCTQTVTKQDWMLAAGIATAVSTPNEVLSKLGVTGAGVAYCSDEVKFGGVLGLLDLEDRTKEMSEMDVGRMRWACEILDETHKFSKILGDIVVRAEFASSDAWQPSVLRRVDGDAAIDVVCLSIFWHKPANDSAEHPLKSLCRDLIFSATRVGQGIDLEVERFKRKVDEEKRGT